MSWEINFGHFGILEGHIGINLVIIWCQGSLRRVLESPKVDWYRFLLKCGCPIGTTFGELVDILCELKCQKHVWIAGATCDDC